jgi:hypothetical protein
MESTSSTAHRRVQVGQASAITRTCSPGLPHTGRSRFCSRTSVATPLLAWMPAGRRKRDSTGRAHPVSQIAKGRDAAPAPTARAVAVVVRNHVAAPDDERARSSAVLLLDGRSAVGTSAASPQEEHRGTRRLHRSRRSAYCCGGRDNGREKHASEGRANPRFGSSLHLGVRSGRAGCVPPPGAAWVIDLGASRPGGVGSPATDSSPRGRPDRPPPP